MTRVTMNRALVWSLLLAMATAPAAADGPETGVVTGKVTSAQRETLPGVTVRIEGDRGAQETTTDENGGFRSR